MFLYELDETQPLTIKIVAIVDQLKRDLDKGKVSDWNVDQLLQYFQKYDVILDPTDLYSMIQKPPLKNVISDIQGDKVVFKGQDTPMDQPEDEQQKIVATMAKKAVNIK